MQSTTPLYYPGLAFIILVLSTSTGEPIMQAVNPAIAEHTMWQNTLSCIKFLLNIISFAWSKVAISAAFIIEFRIMFGPSPVQSPLILELEAKIPFSFHYFHVGIRDRFISSLVLRFLSLTLESNFYDVSRIRHQNAKGSCSQCSQNSSENGNWALMILSNVYLLNRLIKTNP